MNPVPWLQMTNMISYQGLVRTFPKLTGKLIPLIEEVLAAGEIEPPQPAPDMLPPAIPEPEKLGDSGHRGRG